MKATVNARHDQHLRMCIPDHLPPASSGGKTCIRAASLEPHKCYLLQYGTTANFQKTTEMKLSLFGVLLCSPDWPQTQNPPSSSQAPGLHT